MTPAGEERLRSHVRAIVLGAGVSASDRDDVGEELLGHLVERLEAELRAGADEPEAVDLAIAAFGSRRQLAGELARTYHSRLWASTIGVLLPAEEPEMRPPAVRWLRLLVAVQAALLLLGLALTLGFETPARALVDGTALAGGVGATVLAYRALARGQRWAVTYAIATGIAFIGYGLAQLIWPGQPGVTVPIGAIFAGVVLAMAHAQRPAIATYVAMSRPLGGGVRMLVVAAFVAPFVVPPASAAVGDPSQVAPEDLQMAVSTVCTTVPAPGSEPDTMRRVTVTVDLHWRRGELLPMGLAHLFRPYDYGDTGGWEVVSAAPGAWWLSEGPDVVDATTAEPLGWIGAIQPSGDLLPDAVLARITYAVLPAAVDAGRTARVHWVLNGQPGRQPDWPTIAVYHAHLDRFLLRALVGCDETVQGSPTAP